MQVHLLEFPLLVPYQKTSFHNAQQYDVTINQGTSYIFPLRQLQQASPMPRLEGKTVER
uniref:Uncharacterized protein n=1 Tax=Solanum tuberosum TaxID=4113 RepID=M1CYJ9_SOLTU